MKKENNVFLYNTELTEYINNMQSQSMSLSSIKKVIDFLDEYSKSDLSIEITDDEMMVIRNIIIRYTIKLCESNNISLENKQLHIDSNTLNRSEMIQEIVNAVKVQEEIFVMVNNEPR